MFGGLVVVRQADLLLRQVHEVRRDDDAPGVARPVLHLSVMVMDKQVWCGRDYEKLAGSVERITAITHHVTPAESWDPLIDTEIVPCISTIGHRHHKH